MPEVTVIIRTKDSEDTLSQVLAALSSQERVDFDLLAMDSGSRDATLAILRDYSARIMQIEPQDYFPGPVLNRAIAACNTPLVVFLNSDTVPLGAAALGLLLKPFGAPEVVATFARQVARPEADSWVRRDYAVSFPSSTPAPDWMPLSLPFAAMRRSAWESRPFYSKAWGSEDTEWGVWARRSGHSIVYVPEAVAMHSHNYTLRQLHGRRFIEGEADAFIYEQSFTVLSCLSQYLRSILRDLKYHIAARDLPGLLASPIRRFVYHRAYYLGHCLGRQRLLSSDPDIRIGQNVVLSSRETGGK